MGRQWDDGKEGRRRCSVGCRPPELGRRGGLVRMPRKWLRGMRLKQPMVMLMVLVLVLCFMETMWGMEFPGVLWSCKGACVGPAGAARAGALLRAEAGPSMRRPRPR